MTVVVDASVVFAVLVDDGPDGRWAEALLLEEALAAPHLLSVEVANILRRAVGTGDLPDDLALLAHRDLAQLQVQRYSYEPFVERIWELRDNLSCYDAWYVAVAEVLGVPMATLDRRLMRAPGPRCPIVTPA